MTNKESLLLVALLLLVTVIPEAIAVIRRQKKERRLQNQRCPECGGVYDLVFLARRKYYVHRMLNYDQFCPEGSSVEEAPGIGDS